MRRRKWYDAPMADAASVRSFGSAVSNTTSRLRHTAIVRITHWITTACFVALLVSGSEIIISHPRFYWGETGNVFTPALFQLPVPASRSSVPTGYGFVLPDQNGWSRDLHFEAAWIVVFTGLLYIISGLLHSILEGDCSRQAPISTGQHFAGTCKPDALPAAGRNRGMVI